MRPVQYIIINKGLGMTPGKMAAQAAHAAVEGVRVTQESSDGRRLHNLWYRGGHYAKIVLQVNSTKELALAQTYIRERGFRVVPIIDEGRTEFGDTLTFTALGCEIVDKDWPHAAETFSQFKLYQDEQRSKKRRFWHRKNKEKKGSGR